MHSCFRRLAAASASLALVVTGLGFTAGTALAGPPAHVLNPWAGAIQYNDPVWQAQVESFAQAMDTTNPSMATAAVADARASQ